MKELYKRLYKKLAAADRANIRPDTFGLTGDPFHYFLDTQQKNALQTALATRR